MREMYIVEQEQDGVQSVVFFRLALLPSTDVGKKKNIKKANINAERELDRYLQQNHTSTQPPVLSSRLCDS